MNNLPVLPDLPVSPSECKSTDLGERTNRETLERKNQKTEPFTKNDSVIFSLSASLSGKAHDELIDIQLQLLELALGDEPVSQITRERLFYRQ